MTVARELITLLGFKVDKTGLRNLETTLFGLRRKLEGTVSFVKNSVSSTLDYFSSISKANLDIDYLAQKTGIATEEFVALRKAAEDFQLDPKAFDQYFSNFIDYFRQAQVGAGKLFEITQKSQDRITGKKGLDLMPLLKNNDIIGAFKQTIDYLHKTQTSVERLNAVIDIFGEDSRGLNNIIEAGTQKLNERAEANRNYGKSFVQALPEQKELEKHVQQFYKSLENLQPAFLKVVLPPLTFLSDRVTQLFEALYKDVQRYVAFSGTYSEFRETALGARLSNIGLLPNGNVSQTNQITINVQGSLSSDQAQSTAETIRTEIENFWQEQVRFLINENPQAE